MEALSLLMANSIFLLIIALILIISLAVLIRKEKRKEKETIRKIKRQVSED